MFSLTSFNFNDNDVRIILINGNLWFVTEDIAQIFEGTDVSMILNLVDEEDKQVINPQKLDTSKMEETFNNNTFRLSIINESGLYAVIHKNSFNNNFPSIKRFKNWVTFEVLPSVRAEATQKLEYLASDRRIVELYKAFSGLNINTNSPQFSQTIQALVMDIINSDSTVCHQKSYQDNNIVTDLNSINNVGGRWIKAKDKAQELGYPSNVISKYKCSVVQVMLRNKTIQRKVNQDGYIFLDCDEFKSAIKQYFDSKLKIEHDNVLSQLNLPLDIQFNIQTNIQKNKSQQVKSQQVKHQQDKSQGANKIWVNLVDKAKELGFSSELITRYNSHLEQYINSVAYLRDIETKLIQDNKKLKVYFLYLDSKALNDEVERFLLPLKYTNGDNPIFKYGEDIQIYNTSLLIQPAYRAWLLGYPLAVIDKYRVELDRIVLSAKKYSHKISLDKSHKDKPIVLTHYGWKGNIDVDNIIINFMHGKISESEKSKIKTRI
jgi:prophage antirepressor-like protein